MTSVHNKVVEIDDEQPNDENIRFYNLGYKKAITDLCNTLEAEVIKSLPRKKTIDNDHNYNQNDQNKAHNQAVADSIKAIKKLFSEIRNERA